MTGLGRAAAAVTIGALMLCATALPATGPHVRTWTRVRRVATGAAASWLLLLGLQLLLTFRDVVGGSITAPAEQFDAFLQLEAGRTLAAATIVTGLVAVGALVTRRPSEALLVLLLSGAALFQLASAGHAGGTVGHRAATLGLWLHTAAACVWVGGLAVLVLAVTGGPWSRNVPSVGQQGVESALSRVAERYSAIAAWAYVILALSGLFSLALRVSAPVDILTSGWGRLLLVKVVALGGLGLIGAAHRRHTLPLLRRGRAGAFSRLAAGEVLVMAAVLGVSAALARTQPPHTEVPATDPVVTLTGYAAPAAPSLLNFVNETRVEPVSLLIAAAALLTYLRWVRRVRAAGTAWPGYRTASAVIGAVGFGWATNGGLAVYGSVLLSAHLALHLALLGLLPIAYALAAPATLGRRALSHREDELAGPREWLEAVLRSPVTALLAQPVVAGLHVAVAIALIYLTPFRELMLTSQVVHLLTVLYLSVIGYLFADAVFGGDLTPQRRGSARMGLLFPYVFVTAALAMHLASTTILLEPGYYGQLSLPWPNDPLSDQQRAGVVVWILGGLSMLALTVLSMSRGPRAYPDEMTH